MDALGYVKSLCQHDADACRLIDDLFNFVVVWDDAVDGDKRRSEEEINRAFEWALFDFPTNPFVVRHPQLHALMHLMVLNWKVANALQRRPSMDALATAYALRCSPYDVIVGVVLMARGREAAFDAALYLRGADTPNDTFAEFCREHTGA